jgi:hypothetical protein
MCVSRRILLRRLRLLRACPRLHLHLGRARAPPGTGHHRKLLRRSAAPHGRRARLCGQRISCARHRPRLPGLEAAFRRRSVHHRQAHHGFGHLYTVVGVAPPGFHGLDEILDPQFWVPRGDLPELIANSPKEDLRHTKWVRIAARLKPGVTEAQGIQELPVIAERLAPGASRKRQKQRHPYHIQFAERFNAAATGVATYNFPASPGGLNFQVEPSPYTFGPLTFSSADYFEISNDGFHGHARYLGTFHQHTQRRSCSLGSSALGLEVGTYGRAETLMVDVNGISTATLHTFGRMDPLFFGVTSTSPITRLSISFGGLDEIDRIYFSDHAGKYASVGAIGHCAAGDGALGAAGAARRRSLSVRKHVMPIFIN